ncbi:Calcium-binding EF-hand [Corchorus capsularis]|uniref:Calcium-binding EF-hand n=1 Tax=Corchorus capsularis TaxID=210143 RepID=A0A1R3JK77_COCAP|nr:Calcium-binding EF-hand [Corchorus capsularis]
MEEVRETAITYYEHLSQSQKDEATKFFESLDSDGDGKINEEEFIAWGNKRGFKSITWSERLFKELNKDENGSLDFDEVLTLFYLNKSGRIVFCDGNGCEAFLKGNYFTCVKCFSARMSAQGTCDLCCSCYRNNNFNHRDDHTTFVDNYALLLSIWRQEDKPSASVDVDVEVDIASCIDLAQLNGCSNGKYAANSTYSKNLDLILSTMPSNASENGGFYNTSSGQDPDEVYALALCRGDLALESCFNCINSSIEGIKKQCPNQKEALFWGPILSSSTCMLRYSNLNILSIMDTTPSVPVSNPNDISSSNLEQFNETIYKLMDTLLMNASSASPSKFAAGDMNFTSSDKIYGLVQCTPDISESDCRICLRGAVGELSGCCGTKQGGRILRPSCFAWFELNLFYDLSTIDTPSLYPFDPKPQTPAEFAPPATITNKGSGRTKSRTIIIIVLPIVIFLAAVIVFYVIFHRRKAMSNQDGK